jgi:hypothetical protein
MSALGQKQTSRHVRAMSALPPKADIEPRLRDVRFVPKADNSALRQRLALFDHLLDSRKRRRRDRQTEHFRSFEINGTKSSTSGSIPAFSFLIAF